jgi:hypothetical protein
MYIYMLTIWRALLAPTGISPSTWTHVIHTLWVYLRASNSTKHHGSHKHRGFEYCGSEHRGFTQHRSSEHRGSNKHHHLEHRGFTEHRGSTRFPTQYRVVTRAKLQYTWRAYALSSTSFSHLIVISLLSIVPDFYFTRKQSPIDLVACYYFIIRGISVDTTAP